jgi:hypothetical protein
VSITVARVLISGDRHELETEWNIRHPEHRLIAGAIELKLPSHQYDELRSWFRQFQSRVAIEWQEQLDLVYEDQDLERCRILTFWISGSAGPGDNTCSRAYLYTSICPHCGVEQFRNQIAPLVLDPGCVSNTDFSATDHHELICSERVKKTLSSIPLPALRFGSVSWSGNRAPNAPAMYQLCVDAQLGPLSGSIRIKREDRCEICAEYRNIGLDAPSYAGERELRFPAASYHGEAFARTMECFGDRRKFPLLIISNSLFQLLRNYQFTGWWAEPAHIESQD